MKLILIATVLTVILELVLPLAVKGSCVHLRKSRRQRKKMFAQIFEDYFQGRISYNIIPEYKDASVIRYSDYHDKLFGSQGYGFHPSSKQTKVYGESRCPTSSPLLRNKQPSTACPHFIVMDVDEFREPRSIAKAKCSCQRCLDMNNSIATRTGNMCQEVNTYVPVIRWRCPVGKRQRTNGRRRNHYKYTIHLEEVTVGCTCVRPELR